MNTLNIDKNTKIPIIELIQINNVHNIYFKWRFENTKCPNIYDDLILLKNTLTYISMS